LTKHSTIVLGIHDGHDSSAALVKDGQVLAAITEERIRNIKHYSGVPTNSIKEVFNISGIDPTQVDLIAIAGLVRVHSPLKEFPFYIRLYEKFSPIIAHPKFAKSKGWIPAIISSLFLVVSKAKIM